MEATKLLMQGLKSRADKDDHDSRRRLLNAIKELASATSKMAQLAKGVATSPDRAAIGKRSSLDPLVVRIFQTQRVR